VGLTTKIATGEKTWPVRDFQGVGRRAPKRDSPEVCPPPWIC